MSYTERIPAAPPHGFDAGAVALPTPGRRLPEQRRWHAAVIVAAIAAGLTPEQIATGVPTSIAARVLDPLEYAECIAHADILAAALGGEPVAA
jgi:hypothetical protein